MGLKLIIFDLDGVLVDVMSSWAFVHEHYGVNNDTSLEAYLKGEIDDHEFMRLDIALWLDIKSRLHVSEIREICDRIPLMPGVPETFERLENLGLRSAIVSGGLDLVAERVANKFAIGSCRSNGIEVDANGYLTGNGLSGVPLSQKGIPVIDLQESLGLKKEECVAIGNSMVDIPMFSACGLGIAFAPDDEEVRRAADVVIESRDLRDILGVIEKSI